MANKNITRRVLIILITVVIVVGLAALYYFRDISNTYYFVGLETAECEVDKTSSQCSMYVIHAQTATGDDVYFYYDKSKLIVDNRNGQLSGFTTNEKVQVTTIGGTSNISKIRAVN